MYARTSRKLIEKNVKIPEKHYIPARATSFRWFSQIVNLELDLGRALFFPLLAAGAADHVPRDDPCRTSPDLTYSRLCLCPLIQTKPRRG